MKRTLVPACGGKEKPFLVNGRRWLYCWCKETGEHVYLDLDNDQVVWNRNFHPSWAPEFEHVPESHPPLHPNSRPQTEAEDFYF